MSFYPFLVEGDSGNMEELPPLLQVNDLSTIMQVTCLRMWQWDMTEERKGQLKVVCWKKSMDFYCKI